MRLFKYVKWWFINMVNIDEIPNLYTVYHVYFMSATYKIFIRRKFIFHIFCVIYVTACMLHSSFKSALGKMSALLLRSPITNRHAKQCHSFHFVCVKLPVSFLWQWMFQCDHIALWDWKRVDNIKTRHASLGYWVFCSFHT